MATATLLDFTKPQPRDKAGARIFRDLMDLTPDARREITATFDSKEWALVTAAGERDVGTAFALWKDDPEGFVTQVLGETMWSKSRAICESVTKHRATAVPSCFASSKTWLTARLVLWHSFTNVPGTSKCVTLAPKWSQVIRLIWPEIRGAHSRARLPGKVDQAQLTITGVDGLDVITAYGISAAPHNEHAVQGIHAAESVMVVVDEAGGVGHVLGGNLRAALTGPGDRLIAIGNPPTDDEGSWFETLTLGQQIGDVKVIPIDAPSTPNLSGEWVGPCLSCPPGKEAHPASKHLVRADWVSDTIAAYGEDSPYVQAKVYARFPRGGGARALPSMWVEAASKKPVPERDDLVRVKGVSEPVVPGSWVRLGVDVASDGGDELAISRCVGDLVTIEHTSSGADNEHPVNVAGKIWVHIEAAIKVRAALGTTAKVRVKVDANGLGWGVYGILDSWAEERGAPVEVVAVKVSENTERDTPPTDPFRPYRKRDELWLNGRALVSPGMDTEWGSLRLRVDRKTLAQLSAPKYSTNASGFVVIESKDAMRKRGQNSPDRAEAALLAVYEPIVKAKKGTPVRLLA